MKILSKFIKILFYPKMQHKKHKKNNKTVELHNKTHNLVKKEFPKSVCIKMICRD